MRKYSAIIGLLVLLFFFILSFFVYERWDITGDKRYSFSDATLSMIDNIEHPVQIDVYLEGDLTGNFRVLQNETRFLLNELSRKNPLVQYKFINPIENNLNIDSLRSKGIMDLSVPTQDKILRVFPFASVNTQGKTAAVPLLSNQKIPVEQRALASIDIIESNFIKEIYRLSFKERKQVGLLVHHDELLPNYLDGLFKVISKDYDISPFTRPLEDGTNSLQISDIDELQEFDVVVVAKPVQPFTDMDKLVMDQYIMNGGKTLWMVEDVDAEMDSLFRSDRIVAFPRNANLTDLFFAYGVRLMPAIVKDLQSGYITLAIGQTGNNTAYEQFPWPYFPLSIPKGDHPITAKLSNPMRFEFANPIEILSRDSVNVDVLLTTSRNAQLQKPLSFIDFQEIEKVNPENYPQQPGVYPMAVLLEGYFDSAYKGRIESTEVDNFKSKSELNEMIIISDGDFAKNHIFRGEPLPLGADKYSMRPDVSDQVSVIYDNASFLMNALDYLTGDDMMIELNEKQRQLYLLDKNTIAADQNTWRWYNIIFPLIFIWTIAIIGILLRRKMFV